MRRVLLNKDTQICFVSYCVCLNESFLSPIIVFIFNNENNKKERFIYKCHNIYRIVYVNFVTVLIQFLYQYAAIISKQIPYIEKKNLIAQKLTEYQIKIGIKSAQYCHKCGTLLINQVKIIDLFVIAYKHVCKHPTGNSNVLNSVWNA